MCLQAEDGDVGHIFTGADVEGLDEAGVGGIIGAFDHDTDVRIEGSQACELPRKLVLCMCSRDGGSIENPPLLVDLYG